MSKKTQLKRFSLDRKKTAASEGAEQCSDSSTQRSSARKFLSWLPFLLIGIGIAIRVLYLFESRTNPVYLDPVLDAANYHKWALWIVNGKGWPEGVFTANPFYPYLLSMIYRFLTQERICIRIIQILVGVAACILIALTSSRIFGRNAGLVALGLAILYGPFISFEGELLAEVWTVAFISAALYFFSRSRPEEKHQNHMLFLCGLAIGLAILGRPNLLLFVPFAVGWIAWIFRETGKLTHLKKAMVLGLGICIAVAPVTIRNVIKGGEFVLVTAHGGVNFFIGNNEQSTGWFMIPPGSGLKGGHESLIESATDITRRALGRQVTASEVSNYWFYRGVDFILNHPGAYLALVGRKLFYAWHRYEKPLVSNYDFNKRYSATLRYMTIGFWLLGPLALLGMICAFPMGRKIGWLYIFTGIYLSSLLLFFVNARYRLPLIPAFMVFASYGVVILFQTISEHQWREAGIYILIILIFGGLVNYPAFGKDKDIAHMYYLLGTQASQKNDYDGAIDFLKQATSMDPQPTFFNNLGVAYKKRGLFEMAVQSYENAIRSNPDYLKAYVNLGDAYQDLGKHEEAEKMYRSVIRKDPGYTVIYYKFGQLYSSTGQVQEAMDSYKRVIEMDPLLLDPYYMLAELYKKEGLYHEEAEILERLVTISNSQVKPVVFKSLRDYYTDKSPNQEKAAFYQAGYEKMQLDRL